MVPSPGRGGGGKTAIWASGIAANFLLSVSAIAVTERSFERRLSKLSRGMNTAPGVRAVDQALTDRPGKATAWVTPGVASAMALILRITASVRSMVAASGSWATATT